MKTSFFVAAAAAALFGLIRVEQTNSVANAAETGSTLASGLAPGPGREFVLANCIPCHSTALVAANHMSRKQWEKTINTMQKVNGMWPLAPVIQERILDYLEKAQRVDDKGLDAGKQTPWAAPLYRPNPIW